MRHGKAEMGDFNTPDRDRKLVKMGQKESQYIANQLLSDKLTVDLIITSDAQRAYETAIAIAETIGYPQDQIKIEPLLYLADEDRLTNEIIALPETAQTVLMVAHNPGLTDFTNPYLNHPISSLPTSGMIGLHFSTPSWGKIEACRCVVTHMIFPNH